MKFGAVRRSSGPGRLKFEQPLEVGYRIEIGGQHGTVNTIEPILRERELRLVVQLLRDRG